MERGTGLKYQLVIFDFDGTLANSMEWFLKAINELADELQFKRIEPSDHEVIRNYSSAEVMKHLNVPLWKLPRVIQKIRRKAAQELEQIRMFPGVATMLRELAEIGFVTAIVSSNSEENIRGVLGTECSKRIQLFSCGATLMGKAVKLKRVLRKSGNVASSSIYIGDEIRDATAAHGLGMAFGAVSWGYTNLAALEKHRPELTFNRIEEIPIRLCQ